MDIVFLHGALGSAKHWLPISNRFAENNRVFTPDFPGHGLSTLNPVFSLQELSAFLADYLKENDIHNPTIVAYSMGGYVSLNALLNKQIAVNSLITIGTKFNWSPEIAIEETNRLNWDSLSVIKDKLEVEHGVNVHSILEQTKSIMTGIGNAPLTLDNLSKIDTPCTIMVGENDKMVSVDESKSAANALTNGRFLMLMNQPHLLHKMDEELLFNTLNQLIFSN
ncbi:MAG: alpha/beta hydrolase [Bacteroidia bacterium]|nr:alpha/beta hydrolase [Bacteroidia bacterium]